MLRTIARIISVVLVVFAVLWFVDSSYTKFAKDIDLKNPFDVFHVEQPTINKPNKSSINKSKIPKKTTKKNDFSTQSNKKKSNNNKSLKITEKDIDKLIKSIRISKENQNKKYNRENFEKPIKNYKYKGKTLTRNKYAWHISKYLINENPFKYICPYTGLTITDMKSLDFDHIVSLKTVNDNCPTWWTSKEKNKYAHDQLVGVDVLNKSNRSKGAKTPGEWLPDTNIADYCFTYLFICSKYDIAMKKIDIDVCKLEILNAISSNQEINFINKFKGDSIEYEEQQKCLKELKNN